jgi:EAL domain-containing protein (putative c-di-GMP-specific phosphodiesterase class I)
MRTQVMPDCGPDACWVEYHSADGSRPRRKEITAFPFRIGRIESSDLRIESSRVSREHAVIERQGDQITVRDLGSTNGTYVNGRRVQESPLKHGDVVRIADSDLTFGCASNASVTQPAMTHVMAEAPPRNPTSEFVEQMRRWQQAVTHRSIVTLFRPVVQLPHGQPAGYEVCVPDAHADRPRSRAERLVRTAECRLTERFCDLQRLLSAEQALEIESQGLLLFPLQVAELGTNWLLHSLVRLRELLAERHRMVVEVPESAVCDIPHFRSFLERLDQLGVYTVYGDFRGGETQLRALQGIPPDFVKLSPHLVRDLPRASGGQRQVLGVVRAARELGCEVIATGVQTEAQSEVLRELGCRLSQGDLWGRPQPLDAVRKLPLVPLGASLSEVS